MGRTRPARRRTAFKDIKRRARPDTRRIKQPSRNTQFAPPRPPVVLAQKERTSRHQYRSPALTLTQNTTHHRQASHPESCQKGKLLEQISPPFHDRPNDPDFSSQQILRKAGYVDYEMNTNINQPRPPGAVLCVWQRPGRDGGRIRVGVGVIDRGRSCVDVVAAWSLLLSTFFFSKMR